MFNFIDIKFCVCELRVKARRIYVLQYNEAVRIVYIFLLMCLNVYLVYTGILSHIGIPNFVPKFIFVDVFNFKFLRVVCFV